MARTRLYVLVGVDDAGTIVKYGPTSESRELLAGHDQRWPSAVSRVVVCPVMSGALLRVSARSLRAALAHA